MKVPPEYPRVLEVTDSSVIDAMGWNPETKELWVHFSSTDSAWVYDGVSRADVGTMMAFDSVGAGFNRYIRPRYPARRVYPPS